MTGLLKITFFLKPPYWRKCADKNNSMVGCKAMLDYRSPIPDPS
jgi:hypothetical protein